MIDRRKIFEQAAGAASQGVSLVHTMSQEVRTMVRHAVDRRLERMNLVRRSEFEALAARVAVLEKSQATAARKPAKKRSGGRSSTEKSSSSTSGGAKGA